MPRAALPLSRPARTSPARWREVLAAPAVALVTLVVALVATQEAGVRFRDPDNVAAGYVAMVGFAVALLVGLDIVVRAARQSGSRRPSREAMHAVRRTRWTRQRLAAAAGGLLSFYVTYLAYRNLKGVIPFLRPGVLFDRELAELERGLLGGQDPAALLHALLGTGIAAHVLSAVYVAFIVFLPLSLGVALVFARDLSTSLFFATALSLNWLIGAGSYFVLPALGPAYADPGLFAALPHTEVTRLQDVLLDDRIGFLRDPETGTPQAIAAFASLHIAMSFTALAAAHLLNLGRRLKVALWVWLVVTVVATVYLGWHYVVDDVAGVLIGAASLALAKVLTGFDVRAARRARPPAR
ncbi:MAG: phosphatase PAP2 family protein [Actinomycetota bacterium]|nr:phosphatase PAP2 family protein [Actinomycetota bacterium]